MRAAVHRMAAAASKRLIAVCQLNCTEDLERNFKQCEDVVRTAAEQKAVMAFLPECFDYVALNTVQTLAMAVAEDSDFIGRFRKLAADYNIWLSLGGFHEAIAGSNERVRNCHLILNSEGRTAAKYLKLHAFDIEIAGKLSVKESAYTETGGRLVAPVDTPVGRVGLQTCYDVRFAEFSAALREMGADVLTYPSAFTAETGRAHWQTLLRARAIETGCYVVAAAQCGAHNDRRRSHGHAMVVDPWGVVLADCADDAPAVRVVELDLEQLAATRARLPYDNRRRDVCHLVNLSSTTDIAAEATFAFGNRAIAGPAVFYETPLSYAFVNIKPVLDGHVLLCSKREVHKVHLLSPRELSDLFNAAAVVQRCVEAAHGVSSSTISVQDGPDAGQSIKHVHIHILPRRGGDFDTDEQVYTELERHDKGENLTFRSIGDMATEALKYREIIRNFL